MDPAEVVVGGSDPLHGAVNAHGHRAGVAKMVAVELACRLAEETQRAIGAHYGGISSAAVSIIRRKVREGEYGVAAVLAELEAELAQAPHRIVPRRESRPDKGNS